jgi:hypothetical protein
MFYYDSSVTYDSGVVYDAPAPPQRKKMARIKLEMQRLTLAQLIGRCQRVVTMMTGNAVFTSLAAKVTAFSTAVNALVTADADYQSAQQTANQKLTERDDQRVDVENLYRQLAAACEGVTMEGSELESGGWELRGVPAANGPVAAPQHLSAAYGDMAGEVDLQWDPVRGSSSYIGEYASAPAGPWTRGYEGTKSRCTMGGLTSGNCYYFRTAAIGPDGPGPWSDIAEKRAA